jgi:hypothetical protein
MGVVDDLADGLAKDTIAVAETVGDPLLIDRVSKMLGDTSTTTQEAFLTAVRVRLAEKRARKYIEEIAAKAPKGAAKVDLSERKIMNATDDGAAGH